MADGSRAFIFPMPQRTRLRPGEIVVDLFAGGALKGYGVDPCFEPAQLKRRTATRMPQST